MEPITRFGVSIEPSLLKQFDAVIQKMGYSSRSEAIRDMIRKTISERHLKDEKRDVIGTITLVYDHKIGDVPDKLLHIQHGHHTEIRLTSHIHLDEHNCLEVLVVYGMAGSVKKIADGIKAIKGVMHCELVVVPKSL